MTTTATIAAPGGFVPAVALTFGASNTPATTVDAGHPLPTVATMAQAVATPLIGTAAAAATPGPFVPDLGRPIWLTLAGSWTGTVQLLRSMDGGATLLPPTCSDGSAKPGWTGNVLAPVAEESVAGATYWLAITPSSGSVAYRLEQ